MRGGPQPRRHRRAVGAADRSRASAGSQALQRSAGRAARGQPERDQPAAARADRQRRHPPPRPRPSRPGWRLRTDRLGARARARHRASRPVGNPGPAARGRGVEPGLPADRAAGGCRPDGRERPVRAAGRRRCLHRGRHLRLVRVRRGTAEQPDAVLSTDADTLHAVALGIRPIPTPPSPATCASTATRRPSAA